MLAKRLEARWYRPDGAPAGLLPAAWVFGLLSRVRRYAYQSGFLPRPVLPLPVIVVGNISVGGTGKTPVVAWLAERLREAGYRPAIVSRGYGGRSSAVPRLVDRAEPDEFGDEPVLLWQQTGCPVCVCPDRVAAVRRVALEEVDVVISDDGLQHYRMGRVFEIVVVDGQRGFGNGALLPAGPLREPVSRAREADAVVINGQGAEELSGLRFELQPLDALSLVDRWSRPLAQFAGQRVWAVAGIGNPARFTAMLRSFSIQVDETDVPDHGAVSLEVLVRQRDQPIMMTMKDAVKYSPGAVPDVWTVPVRAEFSAAGGAWLLESMLRRLPPVTPRSGSA